MKLSFVWSTPCGLSKVWMNSILEDLAEGENAPLLMPTFATDDQSQIADRLKFLTSYLAENSTPDGQIYLELNFADTQEDEVLEEWLDSREGLEIEFIGVLPANAVDFPKETRDHIENFSRASQSQVIVLVEDETKEDPEWILNKDLDFGRHVNVHVQNFWPKENRVAHLNEYFEPTDFERKTLQTKALYSLLDRERMKTQILAFWNQENGNFLALEYFELSPQALNCLQIVDNKIYAWKTLHPVFRELYRKETAGKFRLQACGFDVSGFEL